MNNIKMNYNYSFIETQIPLQLSQKELYDCFERYHSGDENARQIIIEHNMRLVIYRVLGEFSTAPFDKSDLISIGFIGLIKSVDTFRPSEGIKFATYATRCIDNEILMFMRKETKHVTVLVKQDRYEDDNPVEALVSDMDADLVFSYEEKELTSIVHRMIENLLIKKSSATF